MWVESIVCNISVVFLGHSVYYDMVIFSDVTKTSGSKTKSKTPNEYHIIYVIEK